MAISNKPSICGFLVYPNESDLYGIKEYLHIKKILNYNGLNGFVSPLHTQDGKHHFHILIIRPCRCGFTMSTWREIAELINAANGHVEVIHKPHKYAKYLLHKNDDDKDKQQFNWYQIHTIGFSFKDYLDYCKIQDASENIKNDDYNIIIDILDYIKKYNIIYYAQLVNYCTVYKKEWLPIVINKHNFLISYMRSLEYSYDGFNKDFTS